MKYWTEGSMGRKCIWTCGSRWISVRHSREIREMWLYSWWQEYEAKQLFITLNLKAENSKNCRGEGGVVLQRIQSPSCSKVTLAKPYLLNTSQPPKVWLYAREHTSKIWACAYQLVKTPNVTVAASLGQHEVQTKQGSRKVIVYV